MSGEGTPKGLEMSLEKRKTLAIQGAVLDALGEDWTRHVTVQLVVSGGTGADDAEVVTPIDLWSAELDAAEVCRLTKTLMQMRPVIRTISGCDGVAELLGRGGPGRVGDPLGRIMA